MKTLLTTFVLMLALCFTLAAADYAGSWKLDFDIAGVNGTHNLSVTQDGNNLTGTVKTPDGDQKLTGSVDGETVKFEYDVLYNGEKYHLVFKGKMDGEALKGDMDAGVAVGTFTAKKDK